MCTVHDILLEKGSLVHTISSSATVYDAAGAMNQHKIGALVVTEAGRMTGMFTERDILQRVLGQHRDPATTAVGEVMTRDVCCCTLDTDVDEARLIMKKRRVRHLPVLDGGRSVVGLISIGDLNAHLVTDQEVTIRYLREYLYGNVA